MQQEKHFAVYILASQRNGTLYIGVTSHLFSRTWKHKAEEFKGFTQKYGVKILVWFELHDDAQSAFQREKNLKRWSRQWKLELIEKTNPEWRDLYEDFLA